MDVGPIGHRATWWLSVAEPLPHSGGEVELRGADIGLGATVPYRGVSVCPMCQRPRATRFSSAALPTSAVITSRRTRPTRCWRATAGSTQVGLKGHRNQRGGATGAHQNRGGATGPHRSPNSSPMFLSGPTVRIQPGPPPLPITLAMDRINSGFLWRPV